VYAFGLPDKNILLTVAEDCSTEPSKIDVIMFSSTLKTSGCVAVGVKTRSKTKLFTDVRALTAWTSRVTLIFVPFSAFHTMLCFPTDVGRSLTTVVTLPVADISWFSICLAFRMSLPLRLANAASLVYKVSINSGSKDHLIAYKN
jgi:hypothetical protein